jgi:hypothetical protein
MEKSDCRNLDTHVNSGSSGPVAGVAELSKTTQFTEFLTKQLLE